MKNALQSLREAIPKQDWELATRCCKRAMDIEQDVIEGAFAARVVVSPRSRVSVSEYISPHLNLFFAASSKPSSENPLPPPQALSTLRSQLLETFKEEFQKAADSRDEQSTSRFFKLFPTIGAEVSTRWWVIMNGGGN
jgi:conserved oligomeric Golgi complex subunit 4